MRGSPLPDAGLGGQLDLEQPVSRRASRWIGLVTFVLVGSALAGGGVPLYDGVGFPDDPYRYVQVPAAGMKHGPPASPAHVSGSAEGTAGNIDTLNLQTAEQGPQLLLDLPSGTVFAAVGVKTVTVTATPMAPTAQPPDGTIDGNVYRVTATSDAGPARFGAKVGDSSLYLRAASIKPAPPVTEYRATPTSKWKPVQTTRGGTDVLVSAFKGAGDYALVHQRGAKPVGSGPSQGALFLLLLGGLVVLIGVAVVFVRRGTELPDPGNGDAGDADG